MKEYNDWIDIKGYEGLYQINKKGEIRSMYKRCKNIIMKPQIKKGYYQIALRKQKKRYWHNIHRLIAENFIPNPNKLPQVNHKDENKLNNEISNLEWCTVLYNNTYGTRIDRVKQKTSKKVFQFNRSGEFLKEYPSISQASRETKISAGNIVACCKHYKNYSHAGGYIWKYEREVV